MIEYRKVVFVKPGVVEMQTDKLDETQVPAGQVLLKNRYSLISAGTELACLAGLEGWFQMPAVPGYISVAEIVALGDGVEGFKVGDVIYNYGPHSEYFFWPVAGCFMKIPEGIEEKYVPFVRLASIAAGAIRTSNIVFGDYVAVTGQGGVGIMAAQLAHIQGARAIGIDQKDGRLAIAKQCQVDYTVNSAKADLEAELKSITKGHMVDTWIEAIGNTRVAAEAAGYMAKNGEVILLGTPRTEYTANLSDVFMKVFLGDNGVRFKGAHEWKDPYEPDTFVKHSIIRNTEVAMDYMASGRLVYKPLLTHEFAPEDCSGVYQNLIENKDDYMGVLFNWTK